MRCVNAGFYSVPIFSHALNGSSDFEHSHAIEITVRIMFVFYPGLPYKIYVYTHTPMQTHIHSHYTLIGQKIFLFATQQKCS